MEQLLPSSCLSELPSPWSRWPTVHEVRSWSLWGHGVILYPRQPCYARAGNSWTNEFIASSPSETDQKPEWNINRGGQGLGVKVADYWMPFMTNENLGPQCGPFFSSPPLLLALLLLSFLSSFLPSFFPSFPSCLSCLPSKGLPKAWSPPETLWNLLDPSRTF